MDKVLTDLKRFEACLMQVEKAAAFLELVDLDDMRDPDFVKRCWVGSLTTLRHIKKDLKTVVKEIEGGLNHLEQQNWGSHDRA